MTDVDRLDLLARIGICFKIGAEGSFGVTAQGYGPPCVKKFRNLGMVPKINYVHFYIPVTAPLVLTQVSCSFVTALLQPVYSPERT